MDNYYKYGAIFTKRNVDAYQNPISTPMIEQKPVMDNHSCIILNELPNPQSRVEIENFTEVMDIEHITETNFKVDYKNGIIYFHPNKIGAQLEVHYDGIGYCLITASRIISKFDEYGNVVENIEEMLETGKNYIKAIELLGGAVPVLQRLEDDIDEANYLHDALTDDIAIGTPLQANLHQDVIDGNVIQPILNNTVTEANSINTELEGNIFTGTALNQELDDTIVEANTTKTQLDTSIADAQDDIAIIESTGNFSQIIELEYWVYNFDTERYEYTLSHDLYSENIMVNVIDNATKEPIFNEYKILNNSNILFWTDTTRQIKVILNGMYYKATVTISDNIAQEVVEARHTDPTLNDRLNKLDTLNSTGNFMKIIYTGDWVLNNGRYEHAVVHNLDSKNLLVNLINNTTGISFYPEYKLIDDNSILIYSDTAIEIRVVIGAKFYKAIVPISDKIAEEVIEARDGSAKLKDRFDAIDVDINDMSLYLNEITYIMPPPSDMETNVANFQGLLDKALDKTTKVTIKFNEGTYDLYTCYIHSNTHIILHENTVLRWNNKTIFNPETGTMVSRSSLFMNARNFNEDDSNFTGYDGNGNITIEGGQTIGGCFFSMIHGDNITVKNVKILDTSADHAFQVCASRNVLIDGIKFIGHTTRAVDREYVELVQIDWCTALGFPGFVSTAPIYDHTICDGVTIKNCIFKKSETIGVNDCIYTAIGSHSSDGELQNKNIRIENCKVSDAKYSALTLNRMNNVIAKGCDLTVINTDGNIIENRNSTNITMKDNATNNGRRALYSTYSTGITFSNNTIIGGYNYPVYMQDYCSYFNIKDNTFKDVINNSNVCLIAVRGSNNFVVSGNKSLNCMITGTSETGAFVFVYGNGTDILSYNGYIYSNIVDDYVKIPKLTRVTRTQTYNVKYDSEYNNYSICTIGDSVTNGSSTYGYFQDYMLPLITKVSTHYKRGYGGYCASIPVATEFDSINSVSSEFETTDVYTVFLGTNDFSRNVPVGTLNDATGITNSFYGGLKQLYIDLTAKNMNATIILITPLKRTSSPSWDTANTVGHKLIDYVNAIKDFASNYGCPVIDLFNESGVSNRTASTFLYDGLHPTLETNRRIGKIIGNHVAKYI